MSATRAIADLLRESEEYRRFYRQCCETGALRLRAQAWQFRDELRDRGLADSDLCLRDLEDALLIIARKVLPETPAAQWDSAFAAELMQDALARLAEHHTGLSAEEKAVLELSGQGVWEDRLHQAALDNDPATFSAALKGWERSAGEAFEAARSSRSGAA